MIGRVRRNLGQVRCNDDGLNSALSGRLRQTQLGTVGSPHLSKTSLLSVAVEDGAALVDLHPTDLVDGLQSPGYRGQGSRSIRSSFARRGASLSSQSAGAGTVCSARSALRLRFRVRHSDVADTDGRQRG